VFIYLAAVLGYLAALGGAAFLRSRRAKTADDFLVAGRMLPPGVLAFTLMSAWIGPGFLVADDGTGFRRGFAALWQSAGGWVGIGLIYFVAARVRRMAQYTVPDILELRYGSTARVLATITTVIAYTTIAAYQFRGGGRFLSLIAGVDPKVGSVIIGAFCIAYTALAGMLSVVYLDVFNGSVMIVGFALAVAYVVGHAGGFSPALAALRPDQLTVFGTLSPLTALGLFLPTLCLLLGEGSVYQKFSSARDERAARLGVAGWIVGTIALETLIVSFDVFGGSITGAVATDVSYSAGVRVDRHVLPTLLAMLLVAGAAATMVSTANSMLLTSATNVARDVYQRVMNRGATDRQMLVWSRGIVIALGLTGLTIATFFPTVLATALWAYTMYGAGITPALLATFLWPGATRQGAVASIGAGMITTLVWEIAGRYAGGYPLGMQTICPALLLSIATLVGVSLSTQPQR
jgi:solute:Na+ symporter, SSS family